MNPSIRKVARTFLFAGAVAAVAAFGLTGCSKDDKPATTAPLTAGTSTFTGTMAGATVSGSVTTTIATSTLLIASGSPKAGAYSTQSTIDVTGTLVIAGGPTVTLAGTYDTETKTLVVTGGGYTFTGSFASGIMTGAFTGPAGVSGGFSLSPSTNGSVKVYIGTYTSTTGGNSGNFNLAVSGTTLNGLAVDSPGGNQTPLSGTLTSGTDISLVNPYNPTGPPLATGTLNTSTNVMTGVFDSGNGNSGTWTSALSQ